MSDAPSWATLTDGEEVRFHGRPSIYPYLRMELGALVVVVIGIGVGLLGAGTIASPIELPIPSVVPLAVGALLTIVGTLAMAGTMLRWWSTEHLVTTAEVYEKQGIISRSVTNLPVNRVQKTSFDQSFFGRLLSYGTVRVGTAGTGDAEIVFQHAKQPDRMVSEITEQIDS